MRMRWWDDITNSSDMSLRKFQETVKNCNAWLATVHMIAELNKT